MLSCENYVGRSKASQGLSGGASKWYGHEGQGNGVVPWTVRKCVSTECEG